MRLVQLKLSNFRCFETETVIEFDDLTVFVGKNDSGKSSILDALDAFFNDKVPENDDVCVHTEDQEIRIACVFDHLPPQLVIDAQHPTDLASEHLLNSQGRLEIVKTYSCASAKGKLRSTAARAMHPTADNYDNLLTLTNAKLKQRAKALDLDLANVDQTVNTQLRRAIWDHAPDLQVQEIDVELKSEAAERIWDQLSKSLPVYAVFKSDRASTDQDDEAQDPMRAAVKEAIKAQEEPLANIAEMVKAEVQAIANLTVEKIREMNPDLANQLTPRVKNKNWDSLFSVSLTGDQDIPINKRGSGTRRLVLLNFFRAKAEKSAASKDTGVIYSIEEPETSQHPNNQKLLVDAFQEIAERGGCQVILTTHTPVLARRFDRARLRLVGRENNHPVVRSGANDAVLEVIKDSLGVLPDHNIRAFLGVEGRHDISFLRAISHILHLDDNSLPDLGQLELQGTLVFVPLGGSSLDLWIARLQGLDRPEFYLMDRDAEPPEAAKYQPQADQFNALPHCTAWITAKRELENYIHADLMRAEYPDYAGTGVNFEDVPVLFAQAVHESSDSQKAWADVLADPKLLEKKESNAKKRLNTHFVQQMTVQQLAQTDPHNEVRGWLQAIGNAVNGH
ncbi:MAG: ATP-binding protein [Thermoguttaceae bacterium]|jgi:predicted ATPase